MISINDLRVNVVKLSRSAWLASLGAIATVSQESRQIVEKVSQWKTKQSVTELSSIYHQAVNNIKETLGGLYNYMSMPKFATVS
jgi:uncharacterized Fe-S center protein